MSSRLETVEDLVASGKAALAAYDWEGARADFEAALEREQSVEAWAGLAWAASWLGDIDASFAAREQAFRAYRAAGDTTGAVMTAGQLANDALHFRGDDAVAAGWLERGRALIAGEPETVEHAWLLVIEAYYALEVDGDLGTAARKGAESARLGERYGTPDIEMLGIAIEGAAMVVQGRTADGLRRLDQAAAAASADEFESPLSPAWALCIMIAVCERLGEFGRVAQWCERMHALGERFHGRHLIGVCRSAYGQVLVSRGQWPDAEEELVAALADLESMRPGMAPDGLARLGELRARQGRAQEARVLFERAGSHRGALVGLGTLALDDGDADGAADLAERVLRRLGDGSSIDRVPALELLARASAASADFDRARQALDELAAIVEAVATPYLTGRHRLVAGEVAEVADDREHARQLLEDAVDLFGESSAPYEAALARLALSRALESLGRADAAAAAAEAARGALAALGAVRDVSRSDLESTGELTAREREILSLVAQGLSDAQIADRLVLSPHTVHRHVANVRTKLRLPSRAAAVAYASREGLL